jgi:hypothetical protein
MTIGGKPEPGFPPILEIAGAIPTFPPHDPDSPEIKGQRTKL